MMWGKQKGHESFEHHYESGQDRMQNFEDL